MKVLVTGAGALLGQGIIRALRASPEPCTVVAADPSPLSAGLYWADAAHLLPMATHPAYLEAVRALLRAERPDALLVGTDVELGLFAAHRAELEAEFGTAVVVSSPEVVEIADDKWQTAEFMRRNGFGHARSCLPGGEAELVDEVGFPLIVKPRRGARSAGVRLVRTPAELADAVANTPEPVIQEHLGTADQEYTAGVVWFPGQQPASVVMRRDLRDGNTYRAFVGAFPGLNEEVRRMAEALRPHGPVNFQFRLDEGRAKVFEINGRFSGTTPLRAHAGFNEVRMVLSHLLRGEPVRQPPVRDVVILRHWEDTVLEPGQLLRPAG